MMVVMGMFGRAKFPTPPPPNTMPSTVPNPYPPYAGEDTIKYLDLYDRQMSCVVSPAVCAGIGILLINGGLLKIRAAYMCVNAAHDSHMRHAAVWFLIVCRHAKSIPEKTVGAEQCVMMQAKSDRRIALLGRLSGSVMFFGCFAWNGVNFM